MTQDTLKTNGANVKNPKRLLWSCLLLSCLAAALLYPGLAEAKGKPQPKTVTVTIDSGHIIGPYMGGAYTSGISGVVATIDEREGGWVDYGLTLVTLGSDRSIYMDFENAQHYVVGEYDPFDLPPSWDYKVELNIMPKVPMGQAGGKKIAMHSMRIGQTTTCAVYMDVFTSEGEYILSLSAGWTSWATITRVSETEWHAQSYSLEPVDSNWIANYNRWFVYINHPPDGEIGPYTGNWYAITFSITITEA